MLHLVLRSCFFDLSIDANQPFEAYSSNLKIQILRKFWF